MSWTSLVTGVEEPLLLDSVPDSERFGLRCARISVPDRLPDRFEEVHSALAVSDADLVVLRYPARLVGWFAALGTTGRDLIHADTLVYWRLRVGSGRRTPAGSGSGSGSGLRVGAGASPEAVEDLVGEVFVGYDNHYAADPVLDPDLALAGYQEWAVRSAAGGGTVSVTDGAGVALVALATTATAGDHTEIELAGVRPAHQGRGVYAVLLAGCEDLAAARGSDLLVISTQAHNTAVQRAWSRYGFEPVAAFTTVHALRPGLLGAAGAESG